jgi:copper chaperone NosL
MENNKLNKWIRISVLLSGLMLIPALFVPIWRIELDAPQYPEGLTLKIYANKLGGDVEIVNGLNHYIGMKTLHAEEFVEFTVLPYIIGFFVLFGIVAALVNKKWLFYTYSISFLLFAVLAMADFWRWEYDYGHNLDPNAAIKVPGMSYQPPLIGFKQLLNFGAFSIPGTGGWFFIAAGVLLFSCLIAEIVKAKKQKSKTLVSVIVLLFSLSACNQSPKPIVIGTDSCHVCKMTIMDNRFGGEVVTGKGKVYKFDDMNCAVGFLKSNETDIARAKIYLVDFAGEHALINGTECLLLKSEQLKSPMAGNIAAFSKKAQFELAMAQLSGTQVMWEDLLK